MKRHAPTAIVFAALLLVLFAAARPAAALSAREIMEKVDARDDGDNMTADVKMILIDRLNHKRVREMKVFIKDKGRDTWKMQFFLSPADVRNTAFLTYDYYEGGRDDDQWLYLPALKKTKRIATSDKSGSFMGSDFTYSDMTKRDLEDYDYKLLKEMDVDGHKTWLIEAVPRTKDVIDETGYTRSVIFVRQDNYAVIRAVHYLKKGNRRKYLNVKKLELIDGIWVATEIHMTTKKGRATEHKTILRFTNVKFNLSLDDSMFTVRRLEKGL